MRSLNVIARLLGAEPGMGMLAIQGPGFKMPAKIPGQMLVPAGPEVRIRRRSWAGQAQTLVGLLLILTGISGLAYPLLATVAADLSSPQPSALAPDSAGGLMDPKYFWADTSATQKPSQAHQSRQARSRRPAFISQAAAYSQAARVSLTRGLPLPDIRALIAAHVHSRGRLSVSELNLALDRLAAKKKTTLTAHLCLAAGCGRPGP